jgi:hypothetical protein
MLKYILILMVLVNSLFAGWVSEIQYTRLLTKQQYLEAKVKELDLPIVVVDVFLGKYLRESSIGNYSIGDKEEDKYYYLHQGEKVFVDKATYVKAKRFKKSKAKYTRVKYWGKYWNKKLYVIEGDPKPLTQASLGDYNITFPAIVKVIRDFKLSQYYFYLNKNKTKVVRKLALVNRAISDNKFNTDIALYYFKLNYELALKRGYKNPIRRAISRHNGGWWNKRYLGLIDADIKYVKDALKQNRWNVDIKKYYKGVRNLPKHKA